MHAGGCDDDLISGVAVLPLRQAGGIDRDRWGKIDHFDAMFGHGALKPRSQWHTENQLAHGFFSCDFNCTDGREMNHALRSEQLAYARLELLGSRKGIEPSTGIEKIGCVHTNGIVSNIPIFRRKRGFCGIVVWRKNDRALSAADPVF